MEIKDDKELPPWLLEVINKERDLIQQTNAQHGKQFSTDLGAPGLQIHKLVTSKLGWWAWDNGTGGVLMSIGDGRWVNYGDIDAPLQENRGGFTVEEIEDLKRALAAEYPKQ